MSNTTPQQAIPEWFQKWIDEDCRANCTTILEGKAVWSIGHEAGAIAAYSRLSSPVGLRWVKSSERTPNRCGHYFCKISTSFPGKTEMRVCFLTNIGWEYRDIYSVIEWLEESESPVPIEQEGWIKVSEKMPEGEVLLLTTSQMIYIGDWYVDGWRTCLSQWYPISGSTCEKLIHAFKKEDVTHWRPLPSPPTTK